MSQFIKLSCLILGHLWPSLGWYQHGKGLEYDERCARCGIKYKDYMGRD